MLAYEWNCRIEGEERKINKSNDAPSSDVWWRHANTLGPSFPSEVSIPYFSTMLRTPIPSPSQQHNTHLIVRSMTHCHSLLGCSTTSYWNAVGRTCSRAKPLHAHFYLTCIGTVMIKFGPTHKICPPPNNAWLCVLPVYKMQPWII